MSSCVERRIHNGDLLSDLTKGWWWGQERLADDPVISGRSTGRLSFVDQPGVTHASADVKGWHVSGFSIEEVYTVYQGRPLWFTLVPIEKRTAQKEWWYLDKSLDA
jgi:hypothetical protein